ncbi:hypothetical protein SUNI508_07532 [Seiridium unicorne]|uniref:Uncharacterized protein n=1 Tax=Seiridium unicorne TaxID=138068 RepID=A0ABR2UWQ4_9PEZI
MPSEKQTTDILRDKTDEAEAPPSYEAEAGPSTQTQTSVATTDIKSSEKGPTIASPFAFPADAPAPSYTESATPIQQPIAIPQISPDPAAPFLQAYSPSLLAHGIPPETWASFLNTLSAFLAAKVTDRAISHAADMAKNFGQMPKQFGKNVAMHAKQLGRNISENAKKGNVLGAAFGVIGAAITLPISTAMNAAGAVVSIPSTTVNAVTQKPQTPRARAVVYTTVANKDWFGPRHLRAELLDTRELSSRLGISSNQILQSALSGKSADAETQLSGLRTHISELTPDTPTKLKLGENTLWLVITKENDTH